MVDGVERFSEIQENAASIEVIINSNGIYPTSWELELQFENQWLFKKPRKQI